MSYKSLLRCLLPFYFLKIHFNIILPSMPSSGILPSGFLTKPRMRICLHPYMLHALLITFFWILAPKKYLVRSTEHKAPHYVVLSIPCYLISLRPKYHPQHPTLKISQTMLFLQCEGPSFTPTQNNRKNYGSIHLNLYIFW
jgi:hypothetical protein